jgi:hypothetical protein
MQVRRIMLARMAKASKRPVRQPDSSTGTADRWRPDVIVDFVFDEGKFFIAVENIGDRPAVDVSVRFDRPFTGAGGKRRISTLPLFKGIPFLAPRRRIITFLDTSASYFARREPTALAAAVTYADTDGVKYKLVIRHDLGIYRDVSYLQTRQTSLRED